MNFPAQRISRSLDEAQRNPGCPWMHPRITLRFIRATCTMNVDQALAHLTAHLCPERRASAGVFR